MTRYVSEKKAYELYENGSFVGIVCNKKLADEFKKGEKTPNLFEQEKK